MLEHEAVNNLKSYLDEVVIQYYKLKAKNTIYLTIKCVLIVIKITFVEIIVEFTV